MVRTLLSLLLCVAARSDVCTIARADESPAAVAAPAGCPAQSTFRDSWIKVGERICLKCHVAGGDAADSKFRLQDVLRISADERVSAVTQNCDVFTRMGLVRDKDGRSRLIVKATGGLDHGGGEVLKADSTELSVLQEFVDSLKRKPTETHPAQVLDTDDLKSFFDGVDMLSDQRLLRRVTLSLAARLPNASEQHVVDAPGPGCLRNQFWPR